MIKSTLLILTISSLLLFTACGSSETSVSTGVSLIGGTGGSTTPTNQNHAPTIDTNFSNFSLFENNGTTSYDINISDVDGDELTLSIESNDTNILTVGKNFINPLQQADYKTHH